MEFVVNVKKWIEENKAYFSPPVCNKLMHNNQLKVMFVGGPNQRKDYHIEEGEEMFLLPARIPHSPQRYVDTVGLVIERRRTETEIDNLRYYVEDSTEVLYEKWFDCEDLGKQLVPIMNDFFNSKQYQTGKPDPDQPPEKMPFSLNTMKVMEPFSFQNWLDKYRMKINENKYFSFFADHFETKAVIYGSGESEQSKTNTNVWIWQLEGTSFVTLDGKTLKLTTGDSLLIQEQCLYCWNRDDGCIALCISQDPAQKKPYHS
ncbi:hypothetical protein FKM82_010272 [Ascaphus truei]